ncbi:hypothetical protein EDC19_1080 [Natranaerovirga hydrolytica]|uniref:Uncharacterized protein n=1 Tax=Natranaerovirga hydrolytica TaxID=680378 RepID=A0A4R1MZ96_9FIRM|nr:hypothetical protein [Natranaerovirga hydrolytica]TCK98647.1 hypothetical protein EDC19_1080 [Natranaerovirga hydrolytica]
MKKLVIGSILATIILIAFMAYKNHQLLEYKNELGNKFANDYFRTIVTLNTYEATYEKWLENGTINYIEADRLIRDAVTTDYDQSHLISSYKRVENEERFDFSKRRFGDFIKKTYFFLHSLIPDTNITDEGDNVQLYREMTGEEIQFVSKYLGELKDIASIINAHYEDGFQTKLGLDFFEDDRFVKTIVAIEKYLEEIYP